MLGQERNQRHQNSRRAEPALEGVRFVKRLLERMKVAAGREPLDGPDFVAVGLDREHQARADRFAVEQHGAGATDAVLAPHVGAGKVQFMAQEVGEQEPGLDPPLVTTPIHGQGDGMHRKKRNDTRRAPSPLLAGPGSTRALHGRGPMPGRYVRRKEAMTLTPISRIPHTTTIAAPVGKSKA